MTDPEIQETSDKKLLAQARADFDKAAAAWKDNYQAAIDDLHFLYDENGQWDAGEVEQRSLDKRQCLQINVLPKYVKQVVGEMRRNKVKIKVRPADTKADLEIAKIREGMIFDLEYRSNAEAIYDQSGKSAVECGFGAYRVLSRYTDSNPFQQEVYFEGIDNFASVYMDPDAKDPNFADAKFGFVISKLSRKDFRKEYPDAEEPGSMVEAEAVGISGMHWYDQDTITVAEYYYTEYDTETVALMSDDSILPLAQAEDEIKRAQDLMERVRLNGGEVDESKIPVILNKRTVKKPKIKWAKITGSNVLDKKDIPCKYIPIVLETGEKVNIEGKVYYQGLIRNAKDPQRMLNYWHTSAAETVALAPRVPWLGTPKMFDGFESDYRQAHRRNFPFLMYNPDSQAPGMKPERNSVGQVPVAIFSEISRSEENIKAALGMYNADVGDQGRELSGAAIMARQVPGDTATFSFIDNHARAIAHGGKIANSMLAKIYDSERDARIRNIDNTEQFAPINTTVGRALEAVKANPKKFSGIDQKKLEQMANDPSKGPNAVYNDISEGEYNVVIDTGPSYQTQRMEAADNMIKLAQVSATMNPVDKYFTVINLDFPGADEYAEAIRKQIPYGILPPKAGETPPPPPPPDPQVQIAMVKQQVELERLKTERGRQAVSLAKLANEINNSDATLKQKVVEVLSALGQEMSVAQQMQQMQRQRGMAR